MSRRSLLFVKGHRLIALVSCILLVNGLMVFGLGVTKTPRAGAACENSGASGSGESGSGESGSGTSGSGTSGSGTSGSGVSGSGEDSGGWIHSGESGTSGSGVSDSGESGSGESGSGACGSGGGGGHHTNGKGCHHGHHGHCPPPPPGPCPDASDTTTFTNVFALCATAGSALYVADSTSVSAPYAVHGGGYDASPGCTIPSVDPIFVDVETQVAPTDSSQRETEITAGINVDATMNTWCDGHTVLGADGSYVTYFFQKQSLVENSPQDDGYNRTLPTGVLSIGSDTLAQAGMSGRGLADTYGGASPDAEASGISVHGMKRVFGPYDLSVSSNADGSNDTSATFLAGWWSVYAVPEKNHTFNWRVGVFHGTTHGGNTAHRQTRGSGDLFLQNKSSHPDEKIVEWAPTGDRLVDGTEHTITMDVSFPTSVATLGLSASSTYIAYDGKIGVVEEPSPPWTYDAAGYTHNGKGCDAVGGSCQHTGIGGEVEWQYKVSQGFDMGLQFKACWKNGVWQTHHCGFGHHS